MAARQIAKAKEDLLEETIRLKRPGFFFGRAMIETQGFIDLLVFMGSLLCSEDKLSPSRLLYSIMIYGR